MCLEKTLSVELTAFTFGKSTNKTATRGEPVEDIRILEIGKPDEKKDCSPCFNLHGVTSDGTGAAVSELPPQAEAHKSKQKKTINFFTIQYLPLLTVNEIPFRN